MAESEPSQLVEEFIRSVIASTGRDRLSAELTSDTAIAESILTALLPVAESQFAIEWTTTNGRRVDAGVTAGEREWRVVLSIDEDGIHSAAAIEKPAVFPGVPGGRAVIVNGPSSAGKTTVMTAVVESALTPWVMFDELTFGSLNWAFLIWRDTAPTLAPGFAAGITALASAGNQVILTGTVRSLLEPLRASVPTLSVGLDCPLDVLIERQSGRDDRWGGLTEETQRAHDGWTYDLRFDTSQVSPSQIAAEILRAAGQ